MPEAIEAYTKAIKLYPYFAEAYFNRGLVSIYLRDTEKGCIDISKSGEMGVKDAYPIIKRYCIEEN
jgi:tetratricopeptide (TPR) repeat protein